MSELMSGSLVPLTHIVGIGSTIISLLWFPFPMGNLLLGITSGGQKSDIKARSRYPPLEARAFFDCSCITPNSAPDFILPSVLCLSLLTLTSELTFRRSSTAPCPAQSAGDPKCSHLCTTLQVKLYSQVLHCRTGTTTLPAASKRSYLLSYCSPHVCQLLAALCVFLSILIYFPLLFCPPLGGIS